MPTDSAFWRDLEAQFRALLQIPEAARLTAMYGGGQASVHHGPSDSGAYARLHELFRSTARSAAIGAGVPNRTDALQWWLSLLRRESPHFHRIDGTGPGNVPVPGGSIQNLALASADYCKVQADRAFELENAATDEPPGLRRDRYPFRYWLYDHAYQPETDLKAELEYWKAHVWRGYHVLIENYERLEMAWADRHGKLNSATAGLSYDLAVLQANYVLDRGLRGEDAMRTFRDEAAGLLEEVTSSWRASRERMAVTFDDDTEDVTDLAQPFHRVRDDLRRLLSDLPAGSAAITESPETGPTKSYRTDFGRNVDRMRKECGWSFDQLADKTGLDKKLILGHVNDGKGARPNTVRTYAEAFTKKLNRTVTVAELES